MLSNALAAGAPAARIGALDSVDAADPERAGPRRVEGGGGQREPVGEVEGAYLGNFAGFEELCRTPAISPCTGGGSWSSRGAFPLVGVFALSFEEPRAR